MPSLKILEERVTNLAPKDTNVIDIQELTRLLSIIKLNSHDDGVHGFGIFFNHSCDSNSEVRGSRNLDIYANREIKKGEEISIQ